MVRTEVEVRKIIEQYTEHLKREIEVKKVILYGSYAKGTATKDSDIDIAIESPDFSDDYLLESQRLYRNVWKSGVEPILEPRPIHPVMPDFFIEEIMKTGKVIYEAEE